MFSASNVELITKTRTEHLSEQVRTSPNRYGPLRTGTDFSEQVRLVLKLPPEFTESRTEHLSEQVRTSPNRYGPLRTGTVSAETATGIHRITHRTPLRTGTDLSEQVRLVLKLPPEFTESRTEHLSEQVRTSPNRYGPLRTGTVSGDLVLKLPPEFTEPIIKGTLLRTGTVSAETATEIHRITHPTPLNRYRYC